MREWPQNAELVLVAMTIIW